MNILRLSTVALTIVLFTMGALILPVNTALAHCKGSHEGVDGCEDPHGGGGEDPPPTIAACDEFDLCIVSVGKWHRAPARDYAAAFVGANEGVGNYTEMTSSRFGEILGTPTAAADLCAAFDVVIVEWSSPKIKNWNWQRVLDYTACGGNIILEDPKNVEALAAGVSTIELDLHGSSGPIDVTLKPVDVLTLGGPLNVPTGAFILTFINQHIIFDMSKSDPDLMYFLTLVGGEVVGLYGEFGAGRIVLSGLDSNYHGLLDPTAPNPEAMANHYHLLWNEINWLLAPR